MRKKMVSISAKELRELERKIAAQNRREEKKKARRTDGMSPFLMQRYASALRQVWRDSSQARKLVVKRSSLPGGYSRCEKCKKKVPKVFVDHIIPCGSVDDPGFLERLSVPSSGLQALCHECHKAKTKEDNAETKKKKAALKKRPKKNELTFL